MIARAMLGKLRYICLTHSKGSFLKTDTRFYRAFAVYQKLTGFIFATTSVDEARTISERTFIMSYGLSLTRNFDDLYIRPSTLTVINLSKDMSNIIKAKVSEDEEAYIDILNKNKAVYDKLINLFMTKNIASFITYPRKGINRLSFWNNITIG